MSLMNVYVQRGAAYIVVDTETSVEGQPGLRINGSKFDLFPVARSVLVHVGRGDVAWYLRSALESNSPQSFEALEEILPGYLQTIFDRFAAEEKGGQLELASTFALVGYSREAEQFKCTAFDCRPNDVGGIKVVAIAAPEGCRSPDVPDAPFVFQGLGSMLHHARQQVRFARAEFPGMPCGGNLITVTCLPNSMHIEDQGPA